MIWEFIGACAAILTTFSFVPQIFKVLKTKSVKDVSVATIVQMSAGVSLWIIYGVHLKNVIIVTANGVTLLTLAILLFIYAEHRVKNH